MLKPRSLIYKPNNLYRSKWMYLIYVEDYIHTYMNI